MYIQPLCYLTIVIDYLICNRLDTLSASKVLIYVLEKIPVTTNCCKSFVVANVIYVIYVNKSKFLTAVNSILRM